MNSPVSSVTSTLAARAEVALAEIASLDLVMVRRKVVAPRGWGDRIADYSELRYRRFLCMHLMHPPMRLVPAEDIDVWWHQHILFTYEYARDCQRLFGEFLHHQPVSEADGEDADRQAEMLTAAYLATARFYSVVFGEDYSATDPDGAVTNWLKYFT